MEKFYISKDKKSSSMFGIDSLSYDELILYDSIEDCIYHILDNYFEDCRDDYCFQSLDDMYSFLSTNERIIFSSNIPNRLQPYKNDTYEGMILFDKNKIIINATYINNCTNEEYSKYVTYTIQSIKENNALFAIVGNYESGLKFEDFLSKDIEDAKNTLREMIKNKEYVDCDVYTSQIINLDNQEEHYTCCKLFYLGVLKNRINKDKLKYFDENILKLVKKELKNKK